MNKVYITILALLVVLPGTLAASSLNDLFLNVPTVNATTIYQNNSQVFSSVTTSTLYVIAGNTADIQNKIDQCINSCLIYVPNATYNNVSQINLTSGIRLIGLTERGTRFNCKTGTTCIKATNNLRIYDVEVSNIQLVGDNSANSIGLDTTNISTGRFDTLTINGFEKGIYGNGLNYYNDYYHPVMSGNNYTVYLEGASNAHNFYGGSLKNAVSEALHIDATNQVSFFGTSWEGNAEDFVVTNGGRNIAFMANRFEFIGASEMNLSSNAYGITLIGGLMEGVTINDLGTGNQLLMTDYAYNLGFRGNAKTTLTINDTGQGQTAQTPALMLTKSYAASGSPSGLSIELARAGGNFLNFTQGGTAKFLMEATGRTTITSTQLTGPTVIVNLTGSSANNLTNPGMIVQDSYTGGGTPTTLSVRSGRNGETFAVTDLTGAVRFFSTGFGNLNRAYTIVNASVGPPSTPTPVIGMVYVDSTSAAYCFYNGTGWNNLVNRSLDASCA